ncbi:MAG: GTP-binding protein [Bacillota bacterium]
MIRFSGLDIDELFIESSGLYDPSQICDILDKIGPHLARPYDYKGSACVVDAETFLDYADVLPALENPVAASDLVLINKTDLADGATILEAEARVLSINPNARLHRTTFAQMPFEHLPGSPVEKGGERACVNTVQSRPGSYLLRMPGACSRERLLGAAEALAPHVLRLKGFALCDDGPVLVEVAGRRASVRPAQPPGDIAGTRLVILSTEPDAKALFAEIWKRATGAVARVY